MEPLWYFSRLAIRTNIVIPPYNIFLTLIMPVRCAIPLPATRSEQWFPTAALSLIFALSDIMQLYHLDRDVLIFGMFIKQ